MSRFTVVVLVLLLLTGGRAACAQVIPLDSASTSDSTRRHVVRLRDGSMLVGRITSVTSDSVSLRLESGTVVVARQTVTRVQEVGADRMRHGEYWFENPHATRLLFSATAIPIDRGTTYYSNTWIVLHTFATGVTERLSLGGGLIWFPGVSLDNTFFYVLPKITVVDRPSAKVAMGVLAGWLPYDDGSGTDHLSAGILYGVGTTGSKDSNLSVGLGWGYAADEVASTPIVMVGGQHRVSRRTALITENWFIPVDSEYESLLSYGLRLLGEGLTVDLAFLSPFGSSVAIPWLGFAFRF